ncbi:NAD-dependent epimerase/dehydratase family protein [Paraburkholderia bonniea]|uniref:NAD-dependent epimerase/dehydratase family protein n=1 Tax=Paraburkholderia bonniea TaxID=2152891 RepID=UPI0012918D8C|nr:NAD-dependent epimerase/dehydratase family protein [Paraburkholderia bonniea]WJF89586.1 NAD-dependent epimerase/dehydratase family protein [Paraburkholderia bonniea]WJF92900.1 NAD-dependent epimerase/dehydratase family protein [Paraburkholderia bonniea]
MSVLITGVAGFVGCNLAQTLLEQGQTVFGVDNLCRGRRENLAAVSANPRFAFSVVDMADLAAYRTAFEAFHARDPVTEVWHLAANSDIPAGVNDANVDLRDTFMTTFNTLEIMKSLEIGMLAFASSSAIYGDLGSAPLVEDIGPLLPISNYGAMKLASEVAISAAAESYLKEVFIYRFPNVIGVPATHGVMLDFVRKLHATPDNLTVLGNGTQQKSYLHVEELVDAMLYIRTHAKDRLNYFNVGVDDEGVTVRFIAEEVVRAAAPSAQITFGEGNKGWVGDVPRFCYSIDKLRALGWQPKLKSVEAVRKAIGQIVAQESQA